MFQTFKSHGQTPKDCNTKCLTKCKTCDSYIMNFISCDDKSRLVVSLQFYLYII